MRAESGELLGILSIGVLDLAVILVGFVIWGGRGIGVRGAWGVGGGHRDCCHGLVGRRWGRRGNLYGI